QRHCTALLDRLIEHGAMEGEGERDLSALPFAFDGGIELAEKADLTLVPETHHVAYRQALGGFHESTPARAIETLVERCFDRRLYRAAADAAPTYPRGNHLRVVDHKRVAGAQQVGEIAHAPISKFGRPAGAHDQQLCCIPRRNGTQGNAIRRQLEVEQSGAHGPSYTRMFGRSSP